jgi:hypothetical protein
MVHQRPGGANLVVRGSVTPFLVLLTPFAVFLHHHRYGFARPEVVIVLLAIAAVALLLGTGARWSRGFEVATIGALLTWFADIQLQAPGAKRLVLLFIVLCAILWVLREHAARIVSLMMATVLASSLLPLQRHAAASPPPPPRREVASPDAAARSGLPLIVHLVLDEYIGIEGLPNDLTPPSFKEEIRSFFVEQGFTLFGNAYSEHAWTRLSLGHLLNLVPGRYVPDLTAPGAPPRIYRLTRNAYFERLQQAGYTIRVHGVDLVDVCAGRVPLSACRSYEEMSLAVLHDLPVSPVEKLSVLAGVFLARSHAVMRLKDMYTRSRPRLQHAGVHLPAWNWDRNVVSSVATMGALDPIAADLAASQRGELFFAHLLLPHFPYVYDSECHPRPPSEWRQRRDEEVDGAGGESNTREGRAIRYSLYLEQVRCAQRQIARLLDAIPFRLRNDAVVIIHGDHGSRIAMVEPNGWRGGSFTVTDYADFFSTLFAVRSAELDAGYDLRATPITCLLRTLVESNFTSLAMLNACSSSNVVFFNDHTPHALPDFAAGLNRPAASSSVLTELPAHELSRKWMARPGPGS